MGGGGSAAKAAAKETEQARADEEKRQASIRTGTYQIAKTFSRFHDGFFDKRRNAFVDFARPQIDKQFATAKKQTLYGQARAGLLRSSVAGEQDADLQTEYNINLQDIVDKARGSEIEARNAVESARTGLVTTLNATGDAAGASKAALNRATALSQTPAYSPLSQLFTDATAGISQQAALERAEGASGRNYARYDSGLFSPRTGAVRTT